MRPLPAARKLYPPACPVVGDSPAAAPATGGGREKGRPRQWNPDHFAPVPLPILKLADVSAGAKLLYGLLRYHAGHNGEAWPSFTKLAAELGCTRRQVARYVVELRRRGLVLTVHVPGRDSNTYRFPTGDKSVTSQEGA